MAEVVFTLKGEVCPYPSDDSLTIGEKAAARRAIGTIEGDADGSDPRIVLGLMFTAYARAHPELNDKQVLAFVSALTEKDWEVDITTEEPDGG